MHAILVETPDADRLARLGVDRWPVWEKEVSEFPWSYADRETGYFMEGHVIVTPEGGEPVAIRPGNLVIFPAGLVCTWKVLAPLRKRYCLG